MSEVFDPEKVTRWSTGDEELIPDPQGAFVSAADYDRLLALYREAAKRVMQWERPDSSNQMIP